ncbi:acyl-CoA dehydrogenase family protein [Streptomyces plumbiresistens]|uniref:Acyl-CoA dehydrogenase family protein n=1 Tax=Streptomyces plumbiresistens TaxID=511811 RepID=A0ABP7SJR8_9ACTN
MTITTNAAQLLGQSEEENDLVALAHEFAAKELRPVAAHFEESDEYPYELVRKAASIGLAAYDLPEEYGGGGITSMLTSVRIEEELSWGDVGLKGAFRCGSFFAGPVLALGDEEQRRRWLPRICSENPLLGATAATEPGAGSDAGAMRTTAARVEGGYVLNGQKMWITNAPNADLYAVFATTAPGTGSRGISAFVLEKGDPGFTQGRPIPKMGQNSIPAAELSFQDCFVPEDRRLGEEGGAFRGLMKVFDKSRLHVAASGVGIARAALELAIEYAGQRSTWGKKIHNYQAVSFRIVDAKIKVEQARLLMHHAAKLCDAGLPFSAEASMAKVAASEAAMFAAWVGVQTLGSYGYSREYPAERWFRQAKLEEIYEGTNDIQRLVISRHLFGREGS